jgi:hypothetical protein
MSSTWIYADGAGFPWKPIVPEGHCEICHQAADVLSRVTIERKGTVTCPPGSNPRIGTRLARVVAACGRHAGGNGEPFRAPNQTTLRGTTALRPQAERLFDQIPYRKAGEAERMAT